MQYLTNAGSVRSRGLEVESTLIPLRGLTLNLNGSYNDVRYMSYKDAPCAPEVALQPGAPASCDPHRAPGGGGVEVDCQRQWRIQMEPG